MSNNSAFEENLAWDKFLVERYNATEGELGDSIDCPICKNKGYIRKIINIDEVKGKYEIVDSPCECLESRYEMRKAIASGLGEYLNKTFKDFNTNEEWQQRLLAIAKRYCRAIQVNNSKEWFVVLGQSGCGKTLITSIVANFLMKKLKKQVKYVIWTDFIARIKRDLMSKEKDTMESSSEIEELKNVEVLFIDELMKYYNETDLKYIIEIINYRYSNNLITLITSERSMEELTKVDFALFTRINQMSSEYIIFFKNDPSKCQRPKEIKNVF